MEARIGGAHGKAWMQSRFDMACQEVADALNWLFNLSPPAGAEIGLIEGAYAHPQDEHARTTSGRACNPFFGDSNALASEKHINKV